MTICDDLLKAVDILERVRQKDLKYGDDQRVAIIINDIGAIYDRHAIAGGDQ